MTRIYEQFDKAMAQVGGYAVFAKENYIARVVFKYPRDGAGRLYCYLQVWGAPMVRGHAGGFGYDKGTAAFEAAAAQLCGEELPGEAWAATVTLRDAGAESSGQRWASRL